MVRLPVIPIGTPERGSRYDASLKGDEVAIPGYQIRSDPARFAEGEALYLAVREREGRLLPVDDVRRLPATAQDAPHAFEWRLRAQSWSVVERYLERSNTHGTALDVGCGTGWMTARLAIRIGHALGIDACQAELERATVAFGDRENVGFALADVFEPVLPEAPFDVVVVASAAQYFPDLATLLDRLLDLVSPGGPVLLLDTPLYRDDQLDDARRRSTDYYTRLGVPQMTGRYHHHSRSNLSGLSHELLFDPRSLAARLARRVLRLPRSPFPVVRIWRG